MKKLVIAVELTIEPEHMEAFMREMQRNAAASVNDEPGCRQFDVCLDEDLPHRVFLYEIYDDDAAFAAHLQTSHYAVFNKRTTPWVQNKLVHRYRLVQHADTPA